MVLEIQQRGHGDDLPRSLMHVTRKLAKEICEEDVPRYRIQDENVKGKQAKTSQDEADSIRTSEEGYLPFLEVRGVIPRTRIRDMF